MTFATSTIAEQRMSGALGSIFQRVARVLSRRYKLNVVLDGSAEGTDAFGGTGYTTEEKHDRLGSSNGDDIVIYTNALIEQAKEYAKRTNVSTTMRMVQVFRGAVYDNMADVLFRPRKRVVNDTWQEFGGTLNYPGTHSLSMHLWTNRVIVKRYRKMRHDLLHYYIAAHVLRHGRTQVSDSQKLLTSYIELRHCPMVPVQVRRFGLSQLVKAVQNVHKAESVNKGHRLWDAIRQLDDEFGYWFARDSVLTKEAVENWTRIESLLRMLSLTDPSDARAETEKFSTGTTANPNSYGSDEPDDDEEGDGSSGGDGQEGEGDSDSDADGGQPNSDSDGDDNADGDGDGDGEGEGESEPDSDSQSTGNGAGSGGKKEEEPTVDSLSDKASQTVSSLMNSIKKDLNEADAAAADQLKQDMDALNTVLGNNTAVIPPTGSFRHSNNMVEGQERQAVNKSVQLLRPLQALIDSYWQRDEDNGRVNINTVIKNRGKSLTIFDQWNEGLEDASSMEVVVGVDLSSSMGSNGEFGSRRSLAHTASRDAWTVKSVCDRIGSRCTVMLYNHNFNYAYKPDERADPNTIRVFKDHGNTDPDAVIINAHTILNASPARHKLFVILTDGQWPGLVKDAIDARDSMVASGVVATVLLYPPQTVASWTSSRYGRPADDYTKNWSSIVAANDDPMAITTIFSQFAKLSYQKVLAGVK